MNTTTARREQIVESLQDKEYRDLFVSEEIETGLPFQIRALRKARGWSQQELAKRVGMTQEGVSRLESLNYGRFNIQTLKRLASAFDVGLAVRFVPYSDLVDWFDTLSSEDLAVPDFERDLGLAPSGDYTLGGDHIETRITAEKMPPARARLVGGGVRLLRSPSSPMSLPARNTAQKTETTELRTLSAVAD